jgi:rubrerythrin
MALSTFGAIMGFAAEMVNQTKVTYKALAEKAKDPELRDALGQLAAEEGKDHALMERARREHVTEMILEPITGLYKKDYAVDLKHLEQTADADLLKIALMLQAQEKRFFQDASAKVPLPEVARIFRKISKKKEENLGRLQGLRAGQK